MSPTSQQKSDRNGKDYEVLPILGISRLKLRELGYIVYRNVFLLFNAVIFAVVILLFVFGDREAALFLGLISFLNIFLGLAQDINAWLALEKLQLLTAPHVLRIREDGVEEIVLADQIRKRDRIRLKIGDQVPCDSMLIESHSLEINEGLITGESTLVSREKGDHLLAGSLVTSGSGTIITETVFHESRIARMTEGIKRYSIKLSPIQYSVNLLVRYASYVLIATLIYVISRGAMVQDTPVRIVKNVGALTGMLVPMGLVFAVTLFFAYGAVHFFRRKVLLQEVNATEKLGRIKNLCMDKTGTLTENILVVENMFVPEGKSAEAKQLTAAYIRGTGEASQTIEAVKKFVGEKFDGEIAESKPFSSWRRFGAIQLRKGPENIIVLAGSPDTFLSHIADTRQRQWLNELIGEHSRQGKRLLCVTRCAGRTVPQDLAESRLSVVAVFVFFNNLRPGIRDTINFFQHRNVHIRIISGDNPETVRSVSKLAGIKNADSVVTGQEMGSWSQADFDQKVADYTIFARIVPEQKEKIIEAFRRDGFTAMVGDGANDALAIKKADLGIAMFDGAPATRQLASVVLMNNSFNALPGGVKLADSIIRNIEVLAGTFFNMSFVGFFIFLFISFFGYAYPLAPLNVTLINYFTVGIPGILVTYWAIRPTGKVQPAGTGSFLKRILPFVVCSSVIQAFGATAVFMVSPDYLKTADSNTLVVLSLIILGFVFFVFAPWVYRESVTRRQKTQIVLVGFFELTILYFGLKSAFLVNFFNLTRPFLAGVNLVDISLILALSIAMQYFLAVFFVKKFRTAVAAIQ